MAVRNFAVFLSCVRCNLRISSGSELYRWTSSKKSDRWDSLNLKAELLFALPSARSTEGRCLEVPRQEVSKEGNVLQRRQNPDLLRKYEGVSTDSVMCLWIRG